MQSRRDLRLCVFSEDDMNELDLRLRQLLALEYNCAPEDFDRKENVITLPALKEGRRRYPDQPYFFHMATLGGSAVITADPQLHGFLREWTAEKEGHWLFELPNLRPLERELEKLGCCLTGTFHMFLPRFPAEIGGNWKVRWYEGEELLPLYGQGWSNALCSRPRPERPDRMAVCALDGERIVAMAGCSEDAPGWMQIGIDVLPEYRSRGMGTYLVGLLKNRIEERGSIPFYGTSAANEHSRNIAIRCGFRPAWVEVGAQPLPKSQI